MASQRRTLEGQYGDFSFGGSSGYEIHGFLQYPNFGWEKLTVQFDLLIIASSASDFKDRLKRAYDAFRKPDQDFTIRCNGAPLLQLNKSDHSGFDCLPQVTNPASVWNTGYTKLLSVSCVYALPATFERAGHAGLQNRSVTIAFDTSKRRVLTISGTMTSVRGNDSKEQLEAQLDTICTEVQGAVETMHGDTAPIEWNQDGEQDSFTINYNTVAFSRVYREILFDDAADSVVNQVLSIHRSEDATVQSPGFANKEMITASFTGTIDKTMMKGNDLKGVYDDEISDFIISTMKDFRKYTTKFHIVKNAPSFDVSNNTITATVIGYSFADKGAGSIEDWSESETAIVQTIARTDNVAYGKEYIPIYSDNGLDRIVYQGPVDITRTIHKTVITLSSGSITSEPTVGTPGKDPPGFSGGEWDLFSKTVGPVTPRSLGIDKDTIDMLEQTVTCSYKYIKRVVGYYGSPG